MTSWLHDPIVAVVRDRPSYSRTPPFAPSEAFPEWPALAPSREDNPGYRSVRAALSQLGLDAPRYGSRDWNPLGDLVSPGGCVAIKPNFVAHRNQRAGAKEVDTDCLVTHGSVVRAVVDYAAKALGGEGRVIVGDCPIQGTRWPDLARVVGLAELLTDAGRRFPGIEFRSQDYRLTRARVAGGRVVARESIESDPEHYLELDLGADSLLVPLMNQKFEFGVIQYPKHRMRRAHTPDSNRYVIPRDLLDADLFINLPKMKSHQKAGITCALKNLVGINGHKDYLPHFRFGSPRHGGDEYPDGGVGWDLYWSIVHADWEVDRGARKLIYQSVALAWYEVLHRVLRMKHDLFAQGGGSWHGNDTLWRTVLDINRAFLYYDRRIGGVGTEPRRGYLAVLDGLIGGERESPLEPSPVESGLVLAAHNPLALDTVAATLMGLDFRKLLQLARGYDARPFPLAAFRPEDIVIRGQPGLRRLADIQRLGVFVPFEPSHGWKGHVELEPALAPPGRDAPAA